MSLDIVISCRKDPTKFGLYRTCRIADISVEPPREDFDGVVILSRRSSSVELMMGYAELIARTFAGTMVVDGKVVHQEGAELDPSELAALWRALDKDVAAKLAAAR